MVDTVEDDMAACATGTADTAMCTERYIGMVDAIGLGATIAATIAHMLGQGSMDIAATVTVATVTVVSMDEGIGVA